MFEQSWDFLAVVPMAIADWEKVTVSQIKHVRVRQVRILIHLVWIVGSYTSLCGKRKLGNDIVYMWWITLASACLFSWIVCRSLLWFGFVTFLRFRSGSGLLGLMALARGRSSTLLLLAICYVWQWTSDKGSTFLGASVSRHGSLFTWCALGPLSLALGWLATCTLQNIRVCSTWGLFKGSKIVWPLLIIMRQD